MELQRGCQGLGDGEQSFLFAYLGFYLFAQAFFCLDTLAHIPDDNEQARASPEIYPRTADFGVKRGAILMQMGSQ